MNTNRLPAFMSNTIFADDIVIDLLFDHYLLYALQYCLRFCKRLKPKPSNGTRGVRYAAGWWSARIVS